MSKTTALRHLLFLLIACGYFNLAAQVPNTNIYLFDFKLEGNDLNLSNPQLLTHFNNLGYNNQPSFFQEDLLYLSSNYKGGANTEIFELDLRRAELKRITKTSQSEYSPTLMPDGKHFSVIRQKNTEPMDQHLWKYPIDMSGEGEAIINDLTNVGYHCWIGSYKVIMFLVDDPHQMVEYNVVDGTSEIIAEDIGRALHRRGNVLYYVEKVSRKFWYLKAYNFVFNTVEVITQTPREKEDFVITEDGTFLMSSDGFIYAFSPEDDKAWRKVADLKALGLNKLSRLAVSGNKIAIVNETE